MYFPNSNYKNAIILANLFQLNNQADKMVLKFDNGVMIQGFRITETITSNSNWSNVMFPEPFINDNIFISYAYYATNKRIYFDLGVSTRDKIVIFHDEPIQNQKNKPYGIYIIAIGMWK